MPLPVLSIPYDGDFNSRILLTFTVTILAKKILIIKARNDNF